ncbi:ScbA/BarX family gamma-butyrolactone biosynthesis protein [Saccharothrix sp. ST-888]|uniref:ScbA/BarX family gamma-butyrolactone biosynthesis protein n=1 Tax=Saccharothrix sp. ST-888 TaxID=1427391 RepID=UPI001E35B9AB|nr:ScbA/BarX family gamma-butyrolactone biosynthesis protein [Saccharothrix sp. ST-888]
MTHFTATVPKELVHRAAVAEVLLTRWFRLDSTRFSASAQWPRGHSFFTSPDGIHHDPVLIAETIRQVGTLLAHAEFGVPMDSYFLLETLDFDTDLRGLEVGRTPADLELTVTATDLRHSGRQLSAVCYEAEFLRDGVRAATARTRASFLRPAVYHRIRGGRLLAQPSSPALPAPVEPALVGRRVDSDVVLAPTGVPQRWLLRADVRHPILFDHPNDHLPGMVLIEAARQAARILAPETETITSVDSCFTRFVEYDAPCWIEAQEVTTTDPAVRQLTVRGEQFDQTVFTATVSVPARVAVTV